MSDVTLLSLHLPPDVSFPSIVLVTPWKGGVESQAVCGNEALVIKYLLPGLKRRQFASTVFTLCRACVDATEMHK